MWRARPHAPTGTRAERSASHAKVGPSNKDAGWLAKLVSGIGTSVKPRLRSERKRLVLANPRDARRTPRHPRFPPRASSRRRGDACEARRRRPQAAGSHVPVLARGHRCRRPEASKADAVRRPAPRVGLHQRGRGEIQAHGRTGQGTSRARLWKSPRVAPVIPIRRPRVARGANAPLAWYGFFEFSQRRSPPRHLAFAFFAFRRAFLV